MKKYLLLCTLVSSLFLSQPAHSISALRTGIHGGVSLTVGAYILHKLYASMWKKEDTYNTSLDKNLRLAVLTLLGLGFVDSGLATLDL